MNIPSAGWLEWIQLGFFVHMGWWLWALLVEVVKSLLGKKTPSA